LFKFTEEITKRYSNDDEYDKEFILSQAATEQCKIITHDFTCTSWSKIIDNAPRWEFRWKRCFF